MGRPPKVAFAFSSTPAQFRGMATPFYEADAAFREAIDACLAAASPDVSSGLEAFLLAAPEPDRRGESDDAWRTFVSLFAFQVALAAMWKSWGVAPAGVIGVSLTEISAGCVAEIFSLEDAFRMIAALMAQFEIAPRGGMVTVGGGEERLRALALEVGVEVGVHLAPNLTVLSGPAEAIAKVVAWCKQRGLWHLQRDLSLPFHSRLIDPILPACRRALDGLAFREPKIAFACNRTGDLYDPSAVAAADYWAEFARAPTLFRQGIATLVREGFDTLLEIGPRPSFARVLGSTTPELTVLPTTQGVLSLETMRDTARHLLERGAPVRRGSLPGDCPGE